MNHSQHPRKAKGADFCGTGHEGAAGEEGVGPGVMGRKGAAPVSLDIPSAFGKTIDLAVDGDFPCDPVGHTEHIVSALQKRHQPKRPHNGRGDGGEPAKVQHPGNPAAAPFQIQPNALPPQSVFPKPDGEILLIEKEPFPRQRDKEGLFVGDDLQGAGGFLLESVAGRNQSQSLVRFLALKVPPFKVIVQNNPSFPGFCIFCVPWENNIQGKTERGQKMESLWSTTASLPVFPRLEADKRTDVLIIGGGMAGLLCAYLLEQAGVGYLLAEAGEIGAGVTGNTTGKITAQHGLEYARLLKEFPVELVKGHWQAQTQAVEDLSRLCREIPCDFEEKDAFVFARGNLEALEKEALAMAKLGVAPELVSNLPLPFVAQGLKIPHQVKILISTFSKMLIL